ncbi:MAG: AbrB/MazE/SpoVT family DNA-binding domain-containing protein [Candidatus Thermoplasmatota archaeon]
MSLVRRTRRSGRSIIIALPKQLAEAYNIKQGDALEIIPFSDGELILRNTLDVVEENCCE